MGVHKEDKKMENKFDNYELEIIENALGAYAEKVMDWIADDMKKGDAKFAKLEMLVLDKIKEVRAKATSMKEAQ